MAFSDENKAGDTPVLRFSADVFGDLRGSDFRHPDFRGIIIKYLVDEVYILHSLGVSPVSVNNQVHCSHPLLGYLDKKSPPSLAWWLKCSLSFCFRFKKLTVQQ